MAPPVRVEVSLHRDHVAPVPGSAGVSETRGGASGLLQWLETQLGLQAERPAEAERVLRYAARLGAVAAPSYAASFAADRWSTAMRLLRVRDELRLAGWDGSDDPRLPALVRDLARAEAAPGARVEGVAERLEAVLAALGSGQRLPAHEVVLLEPADEWPERWRAVLARLHVVEAPAPAPRASGRLRDLQAALLATTPLVGTPRDGSLAWWSALSTMAAAQALAASFAQRPERLARTVVCCEDAATAEVLDAAFARVGLPTMGAAHPVTSAPFEVLPLALALAWEPVDPGALLDFLNLPIRPVPARAARLLSDALAEQPGMGSAEWERAWAKAIEPANDPDGRVRDALARWFHHPRARRGDALPALLVRDICGRVAQWAAGLAHARGEDDPLHAALRAASQQARIVGEIIETEGRPVSESQLDRLLAATRPTSALPPPRPMLAGGARWVRSLAEIPEGYDHLVWFGLSAGTTSPASFSGGDRRRLEGCGVRLATGAAHLVSLRAAERAGFARIREGVLFVSLPRDAEAAPHGLWLHARMLLTESRGFAPLRVDDAAPAAEGPWPIPTAEIAGELPTRRRAEWAVEPSLLAPLGHSSPTELETRLACPLRWVLEKQAKVLPSRTSEMPRDVRLVGTFGHALLQAVFGHGGPPPAPDEAAARAEAYFDARLPIDGAPLAMPAAAPQALRARRSLVQSARAFARTLHDGGYRVAAMELTLDGTLSGSPLRGRLDALLATSDGEEAIVDFKYPGGTRYATLLEEGRAVQLATYVHLRESEGNAVHGVAYFLLGGDGLRTPSRSALRGAPIAARVEGPDIHETWVEFHDALSAFDTWQTTGVVPARPLQPATAWTGDLRLVLAPEDETQAVCKYCHHARLCGLKEVR